MTQAMSARAYLNEHDRQQQQHLPNSKIGSGCQHCSAEPCVGVIACQCRPNNNG